MEQEETKTTAATGVEMPPEAESWVQLHESELTELMQKQAKAAITELKRQEKQERKKEKYHNTFTLMKCYRDAVFHIENAISDGQQLELKDYYVYICDSRIDSADEKYVISLNSTYPTGWNATNSRKIGGFHYGRCRKVDSNLQPLNGSSVIFGTGWESAVSNGIVPRSVWTLGHRPKCSPEGMVYLGGGTWVDIYLNSDDGAKGLKSEYGCAPMTGTESMNWYNFVERLAKSGKRLPNYAEFCAYAFGSPAGLDNANTNAWSATSNTGRGVTGSVVNAVSSVGVVDAVGRVWEWLDELITRAEHATNADYHASVAWGWDKKSPLNTGEKSYDVGNIYQYYAYSLAALIAGGIWHDGAYCGARAVSCTGSPWNVYARIGARGACDSL